jgi:glutathione synthase/RimK-type ligase-like ATP-grasp enzyme
VSRPDPPLLIGVLREPVYSPGRFLEADRAILRETARACETAGARVRILPADAPRQAFTGARLVFTMCQGPESLETMGWLATSGVTVVHEPSAILSCHRTRMLPLLGRAGIPRPEAHLVACADPEPETLTWAEECGETGVWVKRGDVHATQPEDVVHLRGREAVGSALARLADRGVTHAVLEAHVPGRTVKFYAVRGTPFFRSYAEDEADLGPALPAWRQLAERAAAALGLAVYGGDLIVGEGERVSLVDVNDWPSFSRCRSEAATAIAEHLFSRLDAPR